MKFLKFFIFLILTINLPAQNVSINNNPGGKSITFGNKKIMLTLDYNNKCVVTNLNVNNETVISSAEGINSGIKTGKASFSTLALLRQPVVRTGKDYVDVKEIKYGENNNTISEEWKFKISDSTITLEITRSIATEIKVEEASFPSINFNSINTWEGAFLGYGGVAWFYLFNEKLCTYGVHSDYSSFWNSKTGNGLMFKIEAGKQKSAFKFSRSSDDKLNYVITLSEKEMLPRYDSSINRRRFIRGKTDVWNAFTLAKGTYKESIIFTPFRYQEKYNRGTFTGIDGNKLTSVMNTIARIGIIDTKHFGGNSWHTPYGPICLHEQYIAELGLAINDPNYIKGYKECLDFYRDNAIQPNGRVIPRWAYDDSDAMPGTATPLGFYEAQWGYLLDSNPDIVINIADVFNQCGDLKWVASHKTSSEKALEYMLKRDSNENNLVEMINSDHKERKGSDWIDIIWASFENAFVNAKLYYALTLWADVEKQLGDFKKAEYYANYAAGLKKSFNKSTADGGLWDEEHKCYVHWRDKDNSIHGKNMVVPVNFMAIAYGICDDEKRILSILNKIEEQTSKEKLFFWPICLYTYEKGDGNDWQFPFPNYENGDIFLSWGSVGVSAYAPYKPEIALKYINNIMNQHSKDGLAFQRYGRKKQDGRGDDILSGNSLAIAGLYRSIFGINPLYNRLYLNPHLTESLYGTTVNFNFRNSVLSISLNKNNYTIKNGKFSISAPADFGFNSDKNNLFYFQGKNEKYSLKAGTTSGGSLSLEMIFFSPDKCLWKQSSSSAQKITYLVNNLQPGKGYIVFAEQKKIKEIKTSAEGSASFEISSGKENELITLKLK